jgi:methyl-accepting chemotaxis protein
MLSFMPFAHFVSCVSRRSIDYFSRDQTQHLQHDVESKLKIVGDPQLTSSMLMMRRHEKDFMLRRDPKYVLELAKTVSQFSNSVAASDILPAIKADIARQVATYQKTFEKQGIGIRRAC